MIPGLRRNHLNDGRGFEDLFERTCDAYLHSRTLRLSKVEPPVKVIGGGKVERRVIFLENPYLDYLGAWTERGGRSLMIEAKCTSGPDGGKLPIRDDSSLKLRQVEWLKRWHCAGAAVGVVWNWTERGSVFLPIGLIDSIIKAERRHIKFEEGDKIEQGVGFVLLDFAANLRKWYPLEG